MSDDQTEQGDGPTLPKVYELPHDAIARWGDLDKSKQVVLNLSGENLDSLMLGLRRGTMAQMELGNALRAISNGERDIANEHFIRHQININDAYSDLNRFIEAVMRGATNV